MASVAIAGTHGFLFEPISTAFVGPLFKSKYSLPIKALSRDPSKETPVEGIEFVKVDYEDPSSVEGALKGVDVVINLIGTNGIPQWKVLADAAAKAGVSKYFTSDFGCDYRKLLADKVDTFLKVKNEHAEYARSLGIPKVVQVYNGLFQKFVFFGFFGHDFANGKAKFYGDGTQKVTLTDLFDIGKAVASVAYRPASELPDQLLLQGTSITLNDSVALYEKATGKKLEIESSGAPASLAEIGTLDPLAQLGTLSAYPDTGSFNLQSNDNEFVNPGLWEWTTLEAAFKASVN
ncbi:hypothetical protein BZA70DRAFT_268800 [Myxozyma melibiosi]|uniref:NmrA-like domain-containing protein n=1 Tax=Myxozyma melibiosi TaxID=54550 RepID=A0ABR1F205_9ASCO